MFDWLPRRIDRRLLASAALPVLAAGCAAPPEPATQQGPTKTVELRPMRMTTGGCQATLQVDWYQADTDVRVRTTIDSEECAAASGTYSIRIRHRDDAGETRTLDFDETWQRDDARPVVIERDYAVGPGVTVTRASGRRLRCVCAEEGDDGG